jgi:hypothetical protein
MHPRAVAIRILVAAVSVGMASCEHVTSAASTPAQIHFVTGPANGMQAARDAILPINFELSRRGTDTHDPKNIQVIGPMRRYELDTNEIINGGSLDAFAKPTSIFCYPLADAGKIFALAWAFPDSASAQMKKEGRFTLGPVTTGLTKAIEKLPASRRLRAGLYEARFLTVEVVTEALWLKSETGGTDFVYILEDGFWKGLEQGALYSVEEFLAVLRPALKDRNEHQ